MKKTNQQKEIKMLEIKTTYQSKNWDKKLSQWCEDNRKKKEVKRQEAITTNDLVLSIDRMFYDCENLEDQSKIFCTILKQFSNYDLEAVKQYVKLSTGGQ